MDFPTEVERNTCSCYLFRLTCNCGFSKNAKQFTCSSTNLENSEKRYYGCPDRYSSSEDSCNFIVWEHEIEHGKFVKCECGDLYKRIMISKMGYLPVNKFVRINRFNKVYSGCQVFKDH